MKYKQLNARHIQFIALGSAIGTGLFYGSTSSIKIAGPAVLLAYSISGLAVFIIMRALGEMSIRHPNTASFSNYASRYLGPLSGFITGWTYIFEMIIVCLADVTAFGIYMSFWYPGIPRWIWISGVILFINIINLLQVRVFGEIEFWLSLIKVVTIIAMIIGGLTIVFFGFGASFPATGLSNLWKNGGFIPYGWIGIIHSLSVVIFSFGGIEIIGITASETENPRKTLPPAINTIPLRIIIFYVLTLLILMSIFPWNTIGNQGSPFVLIFKSLGISTAANILNLVVIGATISAINSDIFGAGRMIYGMAREYMAPKFFLRTTKSGVPWVTVTVIGAILFLAAFLNYLIPKRVFLIMASLASFSTIWVWLMVLLSHFSMRLKIQKKKSKSIFFPVPFWPLSSLITLIFIIMVILILGIQEDTRIVLHVGIGWIVLLIVSWYGFFKKSYLR